MAALTGLEPVTAPPRAPSRLRLWRGVVFLLAAAYFLIPLGASLWYTIYTPTAGVSFAAYGELLTAEGFGSSLLLCPSSR